MQKDKYYKITDIKSLVDQVERLSLKAKKGVKTICKKKGKNFYWSFNRATRSGNATAVLLFKLQHIGVDVSKIISRKDYNFIFGN